jgi:hypothetical protein
MTQNLILGMELEPKDNFKDEMSQNTILKVVGNEKIGRSGRSQMLGYGPGPWRSRFIFNLNMQFLSKKNYFRFRL